MTRSRFYFQWTGEKSSSRFHTGVSLHSHTLHSRESLDFIYQTAKHSRLLQWALRRGEARYKAIHGTDLDLRRGWWTPPLAPRDAYSVEFDQINAMGLTPIVSLTDHDDIEAPMSLQAIDASREIPVSVEWTVPFRRSFFHVGVHNLPPDRARSAMARLSAFTLSPEESALRDILADLHATPGTLMVFNHPFWDEFGTGPDQHQAAMLALLSQCGEYIHALELNGLRPGRENRDVVRLAREWKKPFISGGDRHVLEPNALLNVSNASNFSEFVDEIRSGWSDVLVMSHYRTSYSIRVFHNLLDVFRTYENHGMGWKNWADRVFYTRENETVASLAQIWGDRQPSTVSVFAGLMQLAAHPHIRQALCSAIPAAEEAVV